MDQQKDKLSQLLAEQRRLFDSIERCWRCDHVIFNADQYVACKKKCIESEKQLIRVQSQIKSSYDSLMKTIVEST
jgi:hypothetical protein